MFNKSAKYYDIIYTSMKDYSNEAYLIADLITSLHPGCKTILNVACGTGEHDKYLKNRFHLDGMDINEEFIEIARGKNPECNYYQADMTSFELGKRYDIVMCLFSSIGYVKTLENLGISINCLKNHINDKGMILIEPWFTPQTWHPGKLHMTVVDKNDLKISRINISEAKGNKSFFTLHYLVGTLESIDYFTEYHELGLFTDDQMRKSFMNAGFEVEYMPPETFGRGLYIGRMK